MCRLLGITNFRFSRHEDVVEEFIRLARDGNVMTGDPPGHEDGWGLALYQNGELTVHKSGVSLLEEREKLLGILGEAGSSPVLILHLRKSAWKDSSSARHAHPFHYGKVAFAHNGVVYGYRELLPEIRIPGLGEDALDTEVFFYHFMSAGSGDLGRAFLDTAATIRAKYRYSALNCLFSDGSKLFAYRDYAKEPEYYSLFKACSGDSHVVCSQPIGRDLRWEMMQNGEFLVVP